jgi:hypothetical protein
MNYDNIYSKLIANAKNRTIDGYVETHHVIPTSMGGPNTPNNKVKLTAREHFIAHWLLWKIHHSSEMACAFFAMTRKSRGQKRTVTARQYEIAKTAMSESKKGAGNYWYGTTGPMGGKTHTTEMKERHKDIMKTASEYKKGKEAINIPGFNKGYGTATQFAKGELPWNAGLTGELSHRYGVPLSDETKLKLRKPKEKVTCPHCGLTGGISQMKRWHYENCKSQ